MHREIVSIALQIQAFWFSIKFRARIIRFHVVYFYECDFILRFYSRHIIFATSFYLLAYANYRSSESENALYCISSFRILACCCFYFPTTMVLMYCYGSAFHVNKLRLKRVVCVNTPEVVSGGHIERVSQVYSLCE